jgi:hypothetical protein
MSSAGNRLKKETPPGGPLLQPVHHTIYSTYDYGLDPRARTKLFLGVVLIYLGPMTKALKEAVAEVERLPEADQEIIGRKMLEHVEKLRLLRDDIDAGIRSLDAGIGRELDIDDVISVAHQQHARRR